jgi:hypothetical protein
MRFPGFLTLNREPGQEITKFPGNFRAGTFSHRADNSSRAALSQPEWQLLLPNLPNGQLQRLQPGLVIINLETDSANIRSLCEQVSLLLLDYRILVIGPLYY